MVFYSFMRKKNMAKQIAEKTSMEQQARKQAYEEEQWKLKARTSKIRHKIAVISGKGGVGKSTDRLYQKIL